MLVPLQIILMHIQAMGEVHTLYLVCQCRMFHTDFVLHHVRAYPILWAVRVCCLTICLLFSQVNGWDRLHPPQLHSGVPGQRSPESQGTEQWLNSKYSGSLKSRVSSLLEIRAVDWPFFFKFASNILKYECWMVIANPTRVTASSSLAECDQCFAKIGFKLLIATANWSLLPN